MRALIPLVFTVLGLSGCGILEPENRVCTLEPSPAIELAVVNEDTRLPVFDALVVARDGSYADSAYTREEGPAVVWLGPDRPGTYDVSVEKEGFYPWSRVISVQEGECHPRTEEVIAEINPRRRR